MATQARLLRSPRRRADRLRTARSPTAYRKLAVKYHPDKNPGDEEAIERFKEAAKRSRCSTTPTSASRYDRFGHAGRQRPVRRAPLHRRRGHLLGVRRHLRRPVRRPRRASRRPQGPRRAVRGDAHAQGSGRGRARRTVEFQRHEPCDKCEGTGAEPRAASARRAATAAAAGQVIQRPASSACRRPARRATARARRSSTPARACRGAGQMLKKVAGRGRDSRRRRRRHAGPHDGRKASRAPTAARRATATASSPCCRIRCSSARASTWSAACRSPTRRRRWARRSKCRRSTAAAKSKSRPARNRARCSGWAARACPTRVAAGWATCSCRSSSKCPRKLSEEERDFAAGAGRAGAQERRPGAQELLREAEGVLHRPTKK